MLLLHHLTQPTTLRHVIFFLRSCFYIPFETLSFKAGIHELLVSCKCKKENGPNITYVKTCKCFTKYITYEYYSS